MPTKAAAPKRVDDNHDKHNAIEKALAMMMSFLPGNEAISTTELSRKLGFHKATTSRILKTMHEFGFARQNEATKKYSLGPSIIKLAAAVNKSLSAGLISLSRPYLVELRKKTGLTIVLELMVGQQAVLGCVLEGKPPLQPTGHIGEAWQWNATVGMRAILAFADEEFVEEILKQPMTNNTRNTIADPDKFRSELKKIKKCGYAFGQSEVTIGVDALAAPVFGYDGRPISSVCLVGRSHDIKKSQGYFIGVLKEAANNISKIFMYCD